MSSFSVKLIGRCENCSKYLKEMKDRELISAVGEALLVPFQDTSVPIPPIEYLMAIMVQTGRTKDKARLEEIKKFPSLFDASKLTSILSTYGLLQAWQKIN